nr:MAG TPA: hypothetical protein [Caudoviricetes sp.]
MHILLIIVFIVVSPILRYSCVIARLLHLAMFYS